MAKSRRSILSCVALRCGPLKASLDGSIPSLATIKSRDQQLADLVMKIAKSTNLAVTALVNLDALALHDSRW
jgi:hypothetical protein